MTLKKFLADSKMFEYDKHFRECKKQNQPFIMARKNPIDDNYVVRVDLITCNYNLTIDDKNKIDHFFEKETTILKLNNPKKSIFKGCNIDQELAWYDGILPKRLDAFCENLFDLSYKSHV